MKTELKGTLEIDHDRGVIYFHLSEAEDIKKYESMTPLRICGLTRPIPSLEGGNLLDIRAEEKGPFSAYDTSVTIRGNAETRQVWIDGEELKPDASQQVWNHSPDGFNWGYQGSGPAQLALAILLACGGMKEEAVEKHQEFKQVYVAKWKGDFVARVDVRGFLDRNARR